MSDSHNVMSKAHDYKIISMLSLSRAKLPTHEAFYSPHPHQFLKFKNQSGQLNCKVDMSWNIYDLIIPH